MGVGEGKCGGIAYNTRGGAVWWYGRCVAMETQLFTIDFRSAGHFRYSHTAKSHVLHLPLIGLVLLTYTTTPILTHIRVNSHTE